MMLTIRIEKPDGTFYTFDFDKQQLPVFDFSVIDFNNFQEGSVNNYISIDASLPYACNAEGLDYFLDNNSDAGYALKCSEVAAVMDYRGICVRGFVRFETVGERDSNGNWQVPFQFTGGNYNWVQCLPEKLTDLTTLPVLKIDRDYIESNFLNDEPYVGLQDTPVWFSLKNFGLMWESDNSPDFEDLSTGVQFMPSGNMHPDVYYSTILDAIAKQCNIKIKGSYLDTEFFRRHLLSIPCDNLESKVFEAVPPGVAPVSYNDTDRIWFICPGAVGTTEPRWEVEFAALPDICVLDNSSITFPPGSYKIKLELYATSAADIAGIQQVYPTGSQVFPIVPGSNSIEMDVTISNMLLLNEAVPPGFATASTQIVVLQFVGSVAIDPAQSSIVVCAAGYTMDGSMLDLNAAMPDVKTIDFLRDIIKQHNLVAFWDDKTNCLELLPKFDRYIEATGEFVKGFYQNAAAAKKGLLKVCDSNSSIDINVLGAGNAVSFNYCEDDDDEAAAEGFAKCTEPLCESFGNDTTEIVMETMAASMMLPAPPQIRELEQPLFQSPWIGDYYFDEVADVGIIDFQSSGEPWSFINYGGAALIQFLPAEENAVNTVFQLQPAVFENQNFGWLKFKFELYSYQFIPANFTLSLIEKNSAEEEGEVVATWTLQERNGFNVFYYLANVEKFYSLSFGGSGSIIDPATGDPIGITSLAVCAVSGKEPAPVIPTYLNYDTTDPTAEASKFCNNKPRTLYKVGNVPGCWYWQSADNTAALLENYPYATMFDAARGINLHWCDMQGVAGLLQQNYSKDLLIWKHGNRRTESFVMPLAMLADVRNVLAEFIFDIDPVTGTGYYLVESFQPQMLDSNCMLVVAELIFLPFGKLEKNN